MSRARNFNAAELLVFAVVLLGCRPTSSAQPAEPEPTPDPPEATDSFDPAAVSDAPLSADECARFGKMRAEDPMEPKSAEEYARECEEFTASEDPWMRRVSRCLIDAPNDSVRALCIDANELDARERPNVDALEKQLEESNRD